MTDWVLAVESTLAKVSFFDLLNPYMRKVVYRKKQGGLSIMSNSYANKFSLDLLDTPFLIIVQEFRAT